MSSWIRIADLSDCPPGHARELVVEGRIVALFNVDGSFYALDGVCPHQGGPLGKGELCEGVVTCPWHGWQFDVQNGQSQLSKNIVQPGFPCKVLQGQIYVDFSSDRSDVR